jgi:hypothetical protein
VSKGNGREIKTYPLAKTKAAENSEKLAEVEPGGFFVVLVSALEFATYPKAGLAGN